MTFKVIFLIALIVFISAATMVNAYVFQMPKLDRHQILRNSEPKPLDILQIEEVDCPGAYGTT